MKFKKQQNICLNAWQINKKSVNYIRITDIVYKISVTIKSNRIFCVKNHIERRIKLEEKIQISILLSLYGKLLTKTQQKYMELYYNEDLSLSEIGENENITRQAVRTILVKSKNKLQEYEKDLKFMQKENKIKEQIEKLEQTNINEKQQKIIDKINKELDF